MVLSVQLCLVSRVILLSSELFYKAIQEASVGLAEYDSDPAKVLNKFLHVWTEKMNVVTQVERWKVVGKFFFIIDKATYRHFALSLSSSSAYEYGSLSRNKFLTNSATTLK
jgi:hypothetical protein